MEWDFELQCEHFHPAFSDTTILWSFLFPKSQHTVMDTIAGHLGLAVTVCQHINTAA